MPLAALSLLARLRGCGPGYMCMSALHSSTTPHGQLVWSPLRRCPLTTTVSSTRGFSPAPSETLVVWHYAPGRPHLRPHCAALVSDITPSPPPCPRPLPPRRLRRPPSLSVESCRLLSLPAIAMTQRCHLAALSTADGAFHISTRPCRRPGRWPARTTLSRSHPPLPKNTLTAVS